MAISEPKTVLIVEDDVFFAERIAAIVRKMAPDWRLVVEHSGANAVKFLEQTRDSLILALVDLGLPDISGLDVIRKVNERFKSAPIMVLSVISSENAVFEAIRGGAHGYLLKQDAATDIERAIGAALEGDYPISPSLARYLFRIVQSQACATNQELLTAREAELLQHLARGLTYAESAERMGVKLSTIRSHIGNLYRKLGAHSQAQAVYHARERGFLR